MPWTYDQRTGEFRLNGTLIGIGYSGAGRTACTGRNNPALEFVKEHGPIPAGQWRIGPAYDDYGKCDQRGARAGKGPVVMRLTPVGHLAHGRTGFLIHGDDGSGNASKGCIILEHSLRQRIARSGDTELVVAAAPVP